MLASSGFDCRGGHFKFDERDPWIYAMAYKTENKPSAVSNWYQLMDKNLLPVSAEKAIHERGYLMDSDLLVEWVDHNVYSLSL